MSIRLSNTSSITSQAEEQLDLHKACRIGDLQAIKKAFDSNKQSINERDDKLGWAPIYRTVICGHIEATKFLLENGADPNIKNNLGETSLHQAADNSQYKLASILLESGANPDIQQNDGDTPLHHAAFRGDIEMIKILLKFNANPNIQNTVFNRTPLHYAVDCNHIEAVRIMLQHGANVFIKDRQGKTAFNFALNNEIKVLLKEAEEAQENRVSEARNNQKAQQKQEEVKEVQRQKQLQMIQNYLPEDLATQMLQNFNLNQQEKEIISNKNSQKQQRQEQKTNNSSAISLQDLSGTGQYNYSKPQVDKENEQRMNKQQKKNNFKEFELRQQDQEEEYQETDKGEDQVQEEMTFNPRPEENQYETNPNFDQLSPSQREVSQKSPHNLYDSQTSIESHNIEIKAVEQKIREITEMNQRIQEAVKASIQTAKNSQFSTGKNQFMNQNQTLSQKEQMKTQQEVSQHDLEQQEVLVLQEQESKNESKLSINEKQTRQTKSQLEEPESEIVPAKSTSPQRSNNYVTRDLYQVNTQSSSRNQEEIIQFLKNLKLEYLMEKFVEQGYDDVSQLVEMTRKGLITDENLKQLGIQLPGHRYRIITCLELKAGIQPLSSCRSTRRSMAKESVDSSGMFKCCTSDKTVLKQTCKNIMQGFETGHKILKLDLYSQDQKTIQKASKRQDSRSLIGYQHR